MIVCFSSNPLVLAVVPMSVQISEPLQCSLDLSWVCQSAVHLGSGRWPVSLVLKVSGVIVRVKSKHLQFGAAPGSS